MAQNGIDLIKVSFVVMSLPYLVVTIFLLLVCFRKLTNYLGLSGGGSCDLDSDHLQEHEVKVKRVYQPRMMQPNELVLEHVQQPKPESFTNMAASGIDFFDTPGICQQTRFDSRVVTHDQGTGVYTTTRRQPLSAAQYLNFYSTPYYY